jgi:biotin carboxyl carrier protein
MENELRAPRAGQVSAVKVVEGMSVEAKTVLVTLA